MRRFGLLTTAALALVSMVSVASAAETHRTHPRHALPRVAMSDSLRMPTAGAPYPSGDLWPACLQGPPACTAAGYPNLHWYREIQGLPY
jgi:hypothetical protein